MSPPSPDSSSGRRVLVLMRHGRAEQFAAEDHLRRLTERGVREVDSAGRWLEQHDLVPTHAFVSSAVRTRDTWLKLAGVMGTQVEPVVDDAIYTASPESAMDILRSTPEDAEVVLFLGHNPTAASLAHVLDDGNPDPDVFRAMSGGFPTSAAAVLNVGVPWSELGEATARLVAFHHGP